MGKQTYSEVITSTVLNSPGLFCAIFDKLLAERDDLEKQINAKFFDKEVSHKLDRLNDIFEGD